jgi:hypothetical protein
MDVAWVPGSDTDSLLAKQLYKDRVALPLDTTVVDDPFLTWVKELILRVKNSTTIAKPIGDLHLISHGDDSGWLRLDLDGMSNNQVTYQVVREILDASSPTRRDGLRLPASFYTDSHGHQTATTVVLGGCRVGQAPKFVDAFKKVLGDKVPVVASRYLHEFIATKRRFHGKHAPPPQFIGTYEYLAYGFEVISPTRLDLDKRGRRLSDAAFRKNLINGFANNPKNKWKDGTAVPDIYWGPWLPKKVPRDVGEFKARVKAPLGQRNGTQSEIEPTKNFRHRLVQFASEPIPSPTPDDRTKKGLKARLLQEKTFKASWGFPRWEQYGHDNFDDFFNSFTWKSTDPPHDPEVWTGTRHEYILLVPVTDPVEDGKLLFNFFPPRGSTVFSPIRKLSFSDPKLFYRTP